MKLTSILPYSLLRVHSHSCCISGFFDTSKAQIVDLANRAGKHLVDVHHGLAMKSVTGAIMKVNDLMITVCIVEKAIKNFDGRNM